MMSFVHNFRKVSMSMRGRRSFRMAMSLNFFGIGTSQRHFHDGQICLSCHCLTRQSYAACLHDSGQLLIML